MYNHICREWYGSLFVYDGWTLDTPVNADAFGQGSAGCARPASQGWNVVEVLDANAADVNASGAIVAKYTWGLDLSGQGGAAGTAGIHGAGGIGGLLAGVETGTTGSPVHWYFYDGNGNVGQTLDATTSTITTAATYEYDPYGNAVKITGGTAAAVNPFRFSTKWFDAENGLYYYGYRYYIPRLGRWISRDPIEEEGGLHLYGFVANSPVFAYDRLGSSWWACSGWTPATPGGTTTPAVVRAVRLTGGGVQCFWQKSRTYTRVCSCGVFGTGTRTEPCVVKSPAAPATTVLPAPAPGPTGPGTIPITAYCAGWGVGANGMAVPMPGGQPPAIPEPSWKSCPP